MKNKFLYLISSLAIVLLNACDDKLPEELFEKSVLFTNNGLVDYYIEFNESGHNIINLPISINGTSQNNQNVNVSVGICPDTLDAYNFERFRYRKALYYDMANENMFSFPNGSDAVISAGSEYTAIPVDFDFSKFDLYKKYILPLRITKASPYPVKQDGYSTVLMRLNVSNFFSGNYMSNSAYCCELDNGQIVHSTKTPVRSFNLSALDANTCFLYMGDVDDMDEYHDDYTFTVNIDSKAISVEEDVATGDTICTYRQITLGSKWVDKEFEDVSNGNSYLSVRTHYDVINKNKITYTSTLYLNYRYLNLVNADFPVQKEFNGSFVKSETIDINTGKKF